MKTFRMISAIILAIGLVLLAVNFIVNKKGPMSKGEGSIDNSPQKTEKVAEPKLSAAPTQLSDSWWTYDTLKKSGDVFHHDIPIGYHLHTFADTLHYLEPKGEKKEVVGNGKGYSKELNQTGSVDISYFEASVIVTCLTVKNGQCKYDNIK